MTDTTPAARQDATIDLVIRHYGIRLTIADLARLLKMSPGKIRAEISAETFPIRTYKDKPAKSAPRYADARDVAEYLDRMRASSSRQSS